MARAIQQKIYDAMHSVPYAIGIAVLALIGGGLLVFELFVPGLTQEEVLLIHQADLLIAWIFLTDFTVGFLLSGKTWRERFRYMTHNWINLASSIPITSEATRALRILRLLRAFRIIRAGANLFFAGMKYRENNHTHRP